MKKRTTTNETDFINGFVRGFNEGFAHGQKQAQNEATVAILDFPEVKWKDREPKRVKLKLVDE